MVITGPRVIQTMINDYPIVKKLKSSDNKLPVLAICIQSLIAILILLSGSFDSILTYTTFALTLFSLLTVIGVFILRKKHKTDAKEKTYKTWGYPLTPLVFIIANAWFLFYLFKEKPNDSLIAIGIILLGFVVYLLVKKNLKNKAL
jgi:APA family basic amino acid/polyamine antiporter